MTETTHPAESDVPGESFVRPLGATNPKPTNLGGGGAVKPSRGRGALLVASLAYAALAAAYGARALDAIVTPLSLNETQSLAAFGKIVIAGGLGLLAVRVLQAASRLLRLRGLQWLGAPMTHCILFGAVAFGTIATVQRFEAGYLKHGSLGAREQSLRDLLLVAAATKPAGDGSELATRAATPAGRAVLALRVLVTGRITDQTQDDRSAAALAVRSLVATKIGTAAQVFDHVYVPSVRSVRDAFNDYVAVQEQLADTIRAIPQKQADAWDRYTAALTARGLSPNRLAVRDWPVAIGEAQRAGAPVAVDWNPGDKTLFFASIAQDLEDAAKTAYAKRVSDLLGKDLGPGLSWDQFVAEPVIQSRWSKALGVPGAALSPELDLNEFSETVYLAMVDRAAQPLITLLSDPDRDSGDAVAALERHVVPAFAFCSALLLVAVVGVIVVWDVLAVAGLSRSVRAQVAAGAIVVACFGWFGPWVVDPSMRAVASTIPLPAPLTVMVVEAAPIFHAAGDSVRRHVLGGFGFGFADVRSRGTDIGITRLDHLLSPA
ncbi:MAG TPA: hypothetical protein VKI44_09235 [Acetobacteraceae bacterium]|nr:hypothetical protein [Acetobacteraceae bacterium]